MASTLYEYYNGKLPSVSERAKIAAQYGISNYSGSAAQNTALLRALSGGNGQPSPDLADAKGGNYEPREGDYVAGKGILTPYGTYRPTEKELGRTPTQAEINSAYNGSSTSNSGAIKGVNTNPLASTNTAFEYGAAGRGEFDTTGDKAYESSLQKTGVTGLKQLPGESNADFRRRINEQPFALAGSPINPETGALITLSNDQSAALVKEYGFTGLMGSTSFAGNTPDQAKRKADAFKAQLLGNTSALTSGAYNPQTISGFNNKFKDLKFRLDEINNDPWTNKKEKKNKNEALIKSYTDQFAGLFGSQEEFNSALQNPDFQRTLRQYEQIGGTTSDIAAGIGRPATISVVSETQNPDGSYNVKYSDGTSENRRYSQNADGTYTSNPAQTLDEYLGNVTSPADQKALDSLIPEKAVYQNQIAFEQSIPEKYKALYFGTPEQIGILQQRQVQSEEEIKLLERTAKNDIKNIRAQADFAIDKNNHEMDIEEAKIEENRLAAKNYMTGMLAKLGALQTTGEAPQAITTLEQKYEKQKTDTRISYNLQNKYIELQLNEKIDGVHAERDNNILKIKGDLSKSEEDVWKDVFKYQNDADRKTLDIIEKYAGQFRTQKEKYVKESKAAAEKYAKEFGSIISSVDLQGFREGDYVPALVNGKKNKTPGILTPDGSIRDIRNFLESSRGSDGYVNSATYQEMADAFTRTGGTITEFKKQFPPVDYVNPNDKSLPLNLSYSRPSQTTPKDDISINDI